MYDKQKSIEWLSEHIGLADEKTRAEIAVLQSKVKVNNTAADTLKNTQALADILMNPVENRNIDDFERNEVENEEENE